MGFLRQTLSPAYWFYWTVAGVGARDASNDFPKATDYRDMAVDYGDLAQVGEFLKTVERVSSDTAPKENPPSTSPQTDDFDDAVTSLSNIMRWRRASLDRLDRGSKEELVRLMSDLVRLTGAERTGAQALSDGGRGLSHHEAKLLNLAEEQISKLYTRWETKKHHLEAKAKRIQHGLKSLLDAYTEQHALHRAKHLRRPDRMLHKWYVPLLLLLGILELPINIQAFGMLATTNEALLIALAPSVAIPLLAHFSGTAIRQSASTRGSMWSFVAISLLAIVALMGAIGALGWLRAEFVAWLTDESFDLWNAAKLFLVNFALLAAGVVAAFFAHDPDRELEQIYTAQKRLRKAIDKKWEQWNVVASRYDTLRGQTLGEVNQIRDDARAKIDEYREYNLRYIRTREVPGWFSSKVDNRFFIPRDFGGEIDLTPVPLDEVLRRVDQEQAEADERRLQPATARPAEVA